MLQTCLVSNKLAEQTAGERQRGRMAAYAIKENATSRVKLGLIQEPQRPDLKAIEFLNLSKQKPSENEDDGEKLRD